MNKKGFTLVEVIVSFVLITAVSIALFRTTLTIQQRQKANIALSKFKALNLVLNNEIQYDFLTDKILSTSECGANCYDINFEKKGIVRITIDRSNGTIVYGSFKEKLPEEYTFYDDMTITSYISSTSGNNSYFALTIPVKSNYDPSLNSIKYMYQYDSNNPDIEINYINVTTTIDGDGLYLAGLIKTLANNGTVVSNPYSTINNNIVNFKRATESQYRSVKDSLTEDNRVSTTGTKFDLYMWFNVDTIYYYTEARYVGLSGNMAKVFAEMVGLVDISGLSDFKTTNVTDMNRMFQDSKSIVDLSPIANWDVSNVTDMTFMFGANDGSMAINSLEPLANWDVSNVESFNQTFNRCSNITSLNPIANWNVSRVTNMTQMFNWCGLTDALDIIDWDVRAVTNFTKMLDNNSSLPNNKKPIFILRPGVWDGVSTYIPNSN